VMPLQDAVTDAAPAVLISAAEWTDQRVPLPVAAGVSGIITVERTDLPGETTTLTLDPLLAFGSLQAVHQGQRSVLVATSNHAPEQLDALLGWLNEDIQRWSSLDGTALVAAPGREPVSVSTAQWVSASSAGTEERSPLLLGVGAALVALVAGAAWYAIHRRGKRARGTP
jgi:hypothetical protein